MYLPSDLLASRGVSAESVMRGRDSEDLRACAESVAARAQEHLESSRDEANPSMLGSIVENSHYKTVSMGQCN